VIRAWHIVIAIAMAGPLLAKQAGLISETFRRANLAW